MAHAGMDHFVPTPQAIYPLTDRFTIGLAINPTWSPPESPEQTPSIVDTIKNFQKNARFKDFPEGSLSGGLQVL